MSENDDLEFDSNKEQKNIVKHDDIDFKEAYSVLQDPFAYTTLDYGDYDEERYFTVGMSYYGTIMVVNWTMREDNARIFSARKATPNQRKVYEKHRSK